jgi:hypothetical protein
MRKFFTSGWQVFLLLFFMFIGFFILAFTAEVSYDPGDGIRHYLVSRYSWPHPGQLLYSWGKPFFTLVSSPFSQFGLIGICVFNILCGLVSGFLTYKIARKFNLSYAILAIPFLCFSPAFFPTLNSGLTEPFFGFVLIASIYLMIESKYFWACLLVSFLPFVRTEGLLILPLFFVILIVRKRFWVSPVLAAGTVLYSIIGYFYYKDILWIKNQNPYTGHNKDIYGSGELLHFVKNHELIWGAALGILFVLGCIAIAYFLFSKKSSEQFNVNRNFLWEEIVLIYGAFFIYFVAHSVFWWKGMVGSLGLLRVLAGVMPCSAFICLRGFNLLMFPYLRQYKLAEATLFTVTLVFVVLTPFRQFYFPFKPEPEQAVIKEAGDWFLKTQYRDKKVYYLFPYLAHVLNVDSFDPEKVGELWGLYPCIEKWGIQSIPDSSIVFWDAHFGPNECRIPLDTIMNDPNFQLIQTFRPAEEIYTLGGYKFSVHVFMKLPKPRFNSNLNTTFFDLESTHPDIVNYHQVSTEAAFSGKKSGKFGPTDEFGVTLVKPGSEIPSSTRILEFNSKIFYKKGSPFNAKTVFSVEDENGKSILWESQAIQLNSISDTTEWQKMSVRFTLSPDLLSPKNKIKCYVWNESKNEFYVDDLEVRYIGK